MQKKSQYQPIMNSSFSTILICYTIPADEYATVSHRIVTLPCVCSGSPLWTPGLHFALRFFQLKATQWGKMLWGSVLALLWIVPLRKTSCGDILAVCHLATGLFYLMATWISWLISLSSLFTRKLIDKFVYSNSRIGLHGMFSFVLPHFISFYANFLTIFILW